MAIAKALKPYIEAEAKKRMLIEAHKLRMYRLESIIDDRGKVFGNLKDRVAGTKKESGGCASMMTLKDNFASLK